MSGGTPETLEGNITIVRVMSCKKYYISWKTIKMGLQTISKLAASLGYANLIIIVLKLGPLPPTFHLLAVVV